MKAIVSTKYGSPDVLRLQEVEKPTPKDDEVLVKIHAAAVNAADWHWLRGDPLLGRFMYGLLAPKHTILGADIAGRVEAEVHRAGVLGAHAPVGHVDQVGAPVGHVAAGVVQVPSPVPVAGGTLEPR